MLFFHPAWDVLETTRYSAKGDCSVELMKTGMLKDVNKRGVELDQELAKRISDGGPVLMDAYAFVSRPSMGAGQGF